ncbi:hypothetical protein P171DRAFT_373896 [Karstenula rhodostoma CBS 690.94]|uniref:Thioredoxin domain-containing protein n=1 Tax=Karstenula rhodostoma CBS 690.94 TaxID=1392251 RepID=A0A9P4P4K9_9PLEO|nr:hypothetical protein P171DRAFT_373896 [Karstenula rhodostoma CBS 690.94]
MAIIDEFEAPKSTQELPVSIQPNAAFFILFLSSTDPATKQPWCSDVRESLPLLNKVFSNPSSPAVHYSYVGSRAEYKEIPGSRFRADWDIQNVPTLARYERADGKVKETGRLVERELLDESRVRALLGV